MTEADSIAEALRRAAPGAAEADIRQHAEAIRLHSTFARVNHVRSAGRGPPDALKDLVALNEALGKAFDAADSCRADACNELRAQGMSVTDIARALTELNRHVVAAHEALASQPQTVRRGRPKQHHGQRVATQCARAYAALTGGRPTITTSATLVGHPASGPFLDLVRSVFAAFGITASPESCAREALKTRKEKSPGERPA